MKTNKKKFNFNDWFHLYGLDINLIRTLEPWQKMSVREVAKRAYTLGVKHQKEKVTNKKI